jgi:hypothetical protein
MFVIETFVRDVQTMQNFKIIHVFGSSYEWKMYCWLYFVPMQPNKHISQTSRYQLIFLFFNESKTAFKY